MNCAPTMIPDTSDQLTEAEVVYVPSTSRTRILNVDAPSASRVHSAVPEDLAVITATATEKERDWKREQGRIMRDRG